MDEATKRYEGYVQNIQDSIYTIESYLGAKQGFNSDTPQVIGNLHQVDLLEEEKTISSAIQVLQEYKKMISNEKKRRSMMDIIQAKNQFTNLKTQLKIKRRSNRVRIKPYNEQQAAPDTNVPLITE